jgi:hypothetical protein
MPRVVFELTITVIGLRCEWRTGEGKTVTLLQEGYCIGTCLQRLNKITTTTTATTKSYRTADFQTETRNRDLWMPSCNGFAYVRLTVSLQPCSNASAYGLMVVIQKVNTVCTQNASKMLGQTSGENYPQKWWKWFISYMLPQTLSFRSTAQQHVEIYQLNSKTPDFWTYVLWTFFLVVMWRSRFYNLSKHFRHTFSIQ